MNSLANEMMRMSRPEHHAWEFSNSFHIQLVLVNSRPANCNSLMVLGQSSTSTNYSRVPEACLKRRNSCALWYFGVFHLVLSRRELSCEQLSPLFSLTTFATNSSSEETGTWWWHRLCLPKFVSSLQTSKISLLRFSQVVIEFDDSPSSISSASLALLSRQIEDRPWWEINCKLPMVEKVFLPSVRVCTSPVQLLSLFSFCYESSLCNRVLISFSIHSTNELQGFFRNSSFLVQESA